MACTGERDSGHCFSAYPNPDFPESGTHRKLRFLMFNIAMENERTFHAGHPGFMLGTQMAHSAEMCFSRLIETMVSRTAANSGALSAGGPDLCQLPHSFIRALGLDSVKPINWRFSPDM